MNFRDATSVWPIVLLAAATLGLIVLAVRFSRGSGKSIAPRCRACGYDVSHRPADSTRCSECGADLMRPRSIRSFEPRWRWNRLIVGLLTSSLCGSYTYFAAREFNWSAWYIRAAPDALIIYHAKHAPVREPYVSEWANRRVRLNELIDLLLTKFETASAFSPRLYTLDRLIDDFSEPQLQRYLDEVASRYSLILSQRLRVSELAMVSATSFEGVSERVELLPIEVECSGIKTVLPAETNARGVLSQHLDAQVPLSYLLAGRVVTPGQYRLALHLQLAMGSARSVRKKFDLALEVLPDDYAGEAVALTPAQANAIARQITIYFQRRRDRFELTVVGHYTGFSTPTAFLIDLVDANGTRTIGRGSGDRIHAEHQLLPSALRVDGTIDVVLRGDPRAIHVSAGETEYWPGRIVFEKIRLGTQVTTYKDAPPPYRIEMPTTRPTSAP